MVKHLAYIQKIAGSNPTGPTMKSYIQELDELLKEAGLQPTLYGIPIPSIQALKDVIIEGLTDGEEKDSAILQDSEEGSA